mgnify:FL=1
MSTLLNERAEALRLWSRRYALPIFVIALTVGMTLILSFDLPGSRQISATVGQPAPNDIFSPRSLTYTSDLLTQQARDQAGRGVSEIYTTLDLGIGRAQLAQARDTFSFIEAVRADSSATLERKLEYLQAVSGIVIGEEVAQTLLDLPQSDFEEVRNNIFVIIEDLMRQEIRPSQLNDFQRTARRLASLELTTTQTAAVTELSYQFIIPTVFPDEEATADARSQAAADVQPVVRSVARDQRILRAGEIVTETDFEVLTELGLLQHETDWRRVASNALLSILIVAMIALYWIKFQQADYPNGRYLGVLGGLILLFTLTAKIMSAGEALGYWFPLAALSLLLAVVYDTRFAILVTVLMAALMGFISPNSLETAIYLAAGGILSVLTLRDSTRISSFFRAGVMAFLGYFAVIVMFWLLAEGDIDPSRIMLPSLYALGNGMLSTALTLAGFYILGGLFGIVTILQLQDLSRLDHPLLRELLRLAPGTYHHSIMVANLAEQAAERIGANSTLVRVSAFYHDVGKSIRPVFFIENQEGVDPHAILDPLASVRIIISHVADGLGLARQYRLPFRVQNIIAEHHGTRIVKSFYRKAQEAAGEGVEVNPLPFRYRGPRPSTRESAIVMLADAIDATSTALRPNTERAIEKLVTTIVEEDILEGQLDDSKLSLGDIDLLRASFIETLKGRFHVRVQYPGNEELLVDNQPEAALPAPQAPARIEQPLSRPASQTIHSV